MKTAVILRFDSQTLEQEEIPGVIILMEGGYLAPDGKIKRQIKNAIWQGTDPAEEAKRYVISRGYKLLSLGNDAHAQEIGEIFHSLHADIYKGKRFATLVEKLLISLEGQSLITFVRTSSGYLNYKGEITTELCIARFWVGEERNEDARDFAERHGWTVLTLEKFYMSL